MVVFYGKCQLYMGGLFTSKPELSLSGGVGSAAACVGGVARFTASNRAPSAVWVVFVFSLGVVYSVAISFRYLQFPCRIYAGLGRSTGADSCYCSADYGRDRLVAARVGLAPLLLVVRYNRTVVSVIRF